MKPAETNTEAKPEDNTSDSITNFGDFVRQFTQTSNLQMRQTERLIKRMKESAK